MNIYSIYAHSHILDSDRAPSSILPPVSNCIYMSDSPIDIKTSKGHKRLQEIILEAEALGYTALSFYENAKLLAKQYIISAKQVA